MGPYFGDYKFQQTVRIPFDTTDQAGGAVGLTSAGQLRVYKNNSTTEKTSGITLTQNFDGITGVHMIEIDTTDSFFEPGADYWIALVGATIAGETVNAVLGSFSIENRMLGDVVVGTVTNSPIDGGSFRDSARSSTDSVYVNLAVVFTSGQNRGITRKCTAYNGTDKEFTFDVPFPFAPQTGDHYKVIGLIE